MDDEERIALLLDYENLAIGSREGGIRFLLKPITDALAGRGRVIAASIRGLGAVPGRQSAPSRRPTSS